MQEEPPVGGQEVGPPASKIFLGAEPVSQAMAKRRRRARRKFNMRRVRINSSLSIGALASADLISGNVTNNTSDKLRFISLIAAFGIGDHAALADDGYAFGVAHSDYTPAEIEECLESGGSMKIGDKIEAEKANRLVREIGMINASSGGTVSGGLEYNDGKPVKVKLNWLMGSGEALQLWVRNNSGTIYTTGSTLQISGNLWVRD